MEELVCIFCGSEDMGVNCDGPLYNVYCEHCGACGGWHESRDAAIAEWQSLKRKPKAQAAFGPDGNLVDALSLTAQAKIHEKRWP